MSKPTIPDHYSRFKPRMEVDASDGSVFDRMHYLAASAANLWQCSDEGPYSAPSAPNGDMWRPVHVMSEGLREALLYLMELGVIDVDAERLAQWETNGYPLGRTGLRLASEQPQTGKED